MDVRCSQWGFAASTMTPQHHTGSAIPHFPETSTLPAHVLQHNDAPICPSTASQGAKTLFLHPIWMWDTVNGGLKPLQWHHNIIQARPYPIFPNTQPHLHTYYSIRMHLFAHLQHLNMLKLSVYIQYGCGMQSMGVWCFTMTPQHHTGSAIPHFP